MISNTKYITHEVIHADLSRTYKDKDFDNNDILEWCQIVECRYIKDIETMYKYIGVALTVTDNKTLLPCNIYRLEDIYTNPTGSKSFLDCSNNGEYLMNIPDGYNTIYINYVGTPINEEGMPLIAKGHENACEKYCLLQAYMSEYLNNQISPQIYTNWEIQFSGQISNSRYNFRHKTRKEIDDINIIRGNSIPLIGKLNIKQYVLG